VRDSVRDRIESSDLSVPCRGAVAAVAPALDIEEANLTLRYLVPHKMETRLTKAGLHDCRRAPHGASRGARSVPSDKSIIVLGLPAEETTMAVPADIAALLDDAAEQIKIAALLHDKALTNPTARGPFKSRIKNILENQRSALDYLAVAITERYGTPGKGFIYYPLAASPQEFPQTMDSKMPGVAVNRPDIATKIEAYQPYQPMMQWLRTLNQLTREQKHNRLTAQLVREVYQCRVTEEATGASVAWQGLTVENARVEFGFGARLETQPEPNRPPHRSTPRRTRYSAHRHGGVWRRDRSRNAGPTRHAGSPHRKRPASRVVLFFAARHGDDLGDVFSERRM
jgi:hypothetical protein